MDVKSSLLSRQPLSPPFDAGTRLDLVRTASTLQALNAYSTRIVHKFMSAAEWSRHSCLQFNKLFDVIARRAV